MNTPKGILDNCELPILGEKSIRVWWWGVHLKLVLQKGEKAWLRTFLKLVWTFTVHVQPFYLLSGTNVSIYNITFNKLFIGFQLVKTILRIIWCFGRNYKCEHTQRHFRQLELPTLRMKYIQVWRWVFHKLLGNSPFGEFCRRRDSMITYHGKVNDHVLCSSQFKCPQTGFRKLISTLKKTQHDIFVYANSVFKLKVTDLTTQKSEIIQQPCHD